MDCSMPGFPVLHYLPGLAQIHVHWVSDAISPPHPLLPLSPFAFNLSQHQGPSQWVYLCLKERKVKMKSFSRVRLFVTPWTIQVYGILQVRILKWVAYPFSRGSSWPRNQTRISCIAGGFFTNWAIREALRCLVLNKHLRYPSSKWIHKRQQFYLISYSFPWSSNT